MTSSVLPCFSSNVTVVTGPPSPPSSLVHTKRECGAILDAAIGGTAGDRRTAAARATNPRVPRGASAANGRGDRCLAVRSFHGGRSRWFTLALSDDCPFGLAFGQGPASPP